LSFDGALEFPLIFTNYQGFDCVIGNPPYGNVVDELTNKFLESILTQRSRGIKGSIPSNIFAPMLEIISNLLNHQGCLGYVIPNSSVCSPAYIRIRNILKNKFKKMNISNFSIRPQPLFPGVMQRVAIINAKRGSIHKPIVYTTRYIRPTAETRPILFKNIEYSEINDLAWLREGFIPKLGSEIDIQIYSRIMSSTNNIRSLCEMTKINNSSKKVYYHDSGESYWTKALGFKPVGIRAGKEVSASQWFGISIPMKYSDFVVCLLNSGFFYWYWLTTSDCRHLTNLTVLDCPIPEMGTLEEIGYKFEQLSKELMSCYNKNTKLVEKRSNYASPEITVRNCKNKIDQIDILICEAYGFEREWLDYILSYDDQFRNR